MLIWNYNTIPPNRIDLYNPCNFYCIDERLMRYTSCRAILNWLLILYTQGGVFLAKFRQIGVVVPLILKSLFTVIIIKLVYFLRATPFERRPDAGRKSRGVRNWQQLVLRRSFCRALTRGSSLILISSNNFCAIIRSNALCKIRPKIAPALRESIPFEVARNFSL